MASVMSNDTHSSKGKRERQKAKELERERKTSAEEASQTSQGVPMSMTRVTSNDTHSKYVSQLRAEQQRWRSKYERWLMRTVYGALHTCNLGNMYICVYIYIYTYVYIYI